MPLILEINFQTYLNLGFLIITKNILKLYIFINSEDQL
jgi:hypothetical protein